MAVQNRVYNGFYNPNRSDALIIWLHKLHISERVHSDPITWETSTPHFFQTREKVEALGKFLFVFGIVVAIATAITMTGRYFFYIPPDFYASTMLPILGGIFIGGSVLFFIGLTILKQLPSLTFWKDPAFCQQEREKELEHILHDLELGIGRPNDPPSPHVLVSTLEKRKMYKDLKGYTFPEGMFSIPAETFCSQAPSETTFSEFFDRYGWTFVKNLGHTSPQRFLRTHFGESLLKDFETLGFHACVEKYKDVYYNVSRVEYLLRLLPNSQDAEDRIKRVVADFFSQGSVDTCLKYLHEKAIDLYDLWPPRVKHMLTVIYDDRMKRNLL